MGRIVFIMRKEGCPEGEETRTSYHWTGQPGMATWGQVGWKILIVIGYKSQSDKYTELMVTQKVTHDVKLSFWIEWY